jgi:quinol monooxygenase YgiN
MIVVKIILNTLAEKQLEGRQTLLSLVEPFGKAPGCKSCSVSCDLHDKNRFCLIGEWKTREDLDRHLRSRMFGVLLGIKPLLCEPLHIRIYSIVQIQGMEAVEAVRAKGVSDDNKNKRQEHTENY